MGRPTALLKWGEMDLLLNESRNLGPGLIWSVGERIGVTVVDDHSIVRVGLQQVLDQSGEFEVVGQAADGEEAVRVIADVSPDAVVMPKKDEVEACGEIMEAAPETRAVTLMGSTEEEVVVEAVTACAPGCI